MKLSIVISLFVISCIARIQGAAKEKDFSVLIATWNVKEKTPPGDLANLLNLISSNRNDRPDIIIVGLQEVSAPYKFIINDVKPDAWSISIQDTLVTARYELVKSAPMSGIVMNIYIKAEYSHNIHGQAMTRVMTGFRGFFPNKGAVVVKFNLFTQSFCIVNAHFHAKDESIMHRIQDYKEIESKREEFCSSSSDYVFWLGDLNFRLEGKSMSPRSLTQTIEAGKHTELLDYDQLLIHKHIGDIFANYRESPIKFKPTYKILPGTGNYNQERRPAWTDRVLFKSGTGRTVTPVSYDSLQSYKVSDHYPVIAKFIISVDTSLHYGMYIFK